MNPKQEAFLARIVQNLDGRGFLPGSTVEIARDLGVPPQATHAILSMGSAHHRLVKAGPDLFYSHGQLRAITAHLLPLSAPDGNDPAFFRAEIGLSRRLGEVLLMCLESEGILAKHEARWVFTQKALNDLSQ